MKLVVRLLQQDIKKQMVHVHEEVATDYTTLQAISRHTHERFREERGEVYLKGQYCDPV